MRNNEQAALAELGFVVASGCGLGVMPEYGAYSLMLEKEFGA